MKRLMLVLAMAVLLVAGCAQTLYYHPYKTEVDFERDKYECHREALQTARDFGAAGNIFIIMDEMKRCMKFKFGWVEETK